jgi:hypothetical protein
MVAAFRIRKFWVLVFFSCAFHGARGMINSGVIRVDGYWSVAAIRVFFLFLAAGTVSIVIATIINRVAQKLDN